METNTGTGKRINFPSVARSVPRAEPGWVQFVEQVGLERMLEDKRFDKNGRNSTGHGVKVHELRAEYERDFAHYPAEQLVAIIRKYAGNAATYQRADMAMAHPQTQALKIVRSVASGSGAEIKVRAFPARFSRLQPQPKGVAPRLGEHAVGIAAALGLTAEAIESMFAQGGLERAGSAPTA